MKAIVVKYHGPTNTKGSRYSATVEGGARIMVSKDYSLNPDDGRKQAALALCDKMGWGNILIKGYLPNGDSVFTLIGSDYVRELYAGLDS